MDRQIEKIYGVTTRNKLTVTPDKVTMRFRVGADETGQQRVEDFFLKISGKITGISRTVRGNLARHLPTDTLYIVMKDETDSYSSRFFENEI